jgi:hypothetical protein
MEGTNLLSDTTIFAFSDLAVSKEIQESCFSMIDMAHDCDDWLGYDRFDTGRGTLGSSVSIFPLNTVTAEAIS